MKTNLMYLLGAALCLLASLNVTQAAGHGGGGTGGTGGGTIYYWGPQVYDPDSHTFAVTTMNSDGSGKTPLGLGFSGHPSYTQHNGHRWFLSNLMFRDQYYPDGEIRREVFAFRDDYDYNTNNTAATRVQLTDDTALEPGSVDWVAGDNTISFAGRRWSSSEPDAIIVEGGIYAASLVFDAEGNIGGLTAQPVTPVIALPLVESNNPVPAGLVPDLGSYSWNAAGDTVAYSNRADTGLWVAKLFQTGTQILFTTAHMPVWSPVADLIAFSHGSGIWTVKPDGKGAKQIIRDDSQWWYSHAYFSPDGNSLVFLGASRLGEVPQNMDIFRAPATGGTPVNLTLTPSPYQEQLNEGEGGWRP